MLEDTRTRLRDFIEKKGLSVASFEKSIGASNGSVSLFLLGKNKGFGNNLEKILITFPELNSNWLLSGQRPMILDHIWELNSKNEMYIKQQEEGGKVISEKRGKDWGKVKEKTNQLVTQAVKTDFSEGVIHYPRDQDDLDINKYLVKEGSGAYRSIEMKLYLEYSKAQDALIRHLIQKLTELEERVIMMEKAKK